MGEKAPKDQNSQYKSQKLQAIIVKQLILQHTLEFKKNCLLKQVNTENRRAAITSNKIGHKNVDLINILWSCDPSKRHDTAAELFIISLVSLGNLGQLPVHNRHEKGDEMEELRTWLLNFKWGVLFLKWRMEIQTFKLPCLLMVGCRYI